MIFLLLRDLRAVIRSLNFHYWDCHEADGWQWLHKVGCWPTRRKIFPILYDRNVTPQFCHRWMASVRLSDLLAICLLWHKPLILHLYPLVEFALFACWRRCQCRRRVAVNALKYSRYPCKLSAEKAVIMFTRLAFNLNTHKRGVPWVPW